MVYDFRKYDRGIVWGIFFSWKVKISYRGFGSYSFFIRLNTMAVIPTQTDNKLTLSIDNGDLTKMEEVLEKWGFKDIQSFWRFSVSILLETEDKALWIKAKGEAVAVAPAKHSLKS
jgi:hypothetical protein